MGLGSGRSHFHKSHPIPDANFGGVKAGKTLDPFQDALADVAVSQERPSSLTARSSMPLIDWVESHLRKLSLSKMAQRYNILPKKRIAGMSFGVPVGPGIQEICRRGFGIKIKALVGVSGEKPNRFVLENEVP